MFKFSKSTGGFYRDEVHSTVPDDAIYVSEELHAALMAAQSQGQVIGVGDDGAPVARPRPVAAQTPEQVKAALTRAVQTHLDATAQGMGYDDIKSAVTYADEPAVPKFEAEGKALRAWRSQVWNACIATLNAVTSGQAPVPTTAALIDSLPPFVAPT